MGTKSGKVWGMTTLIFSNTQFEVHKITIKKGGYCSIHKHEAKINSFYVISGNLDITVWKNDYNLVDVTNLQEDDFMIVKPGDYHQFKAIEDTVALEVYWVEDLNPNDIIRKECGGKEES